MYFCTTSKSNSLPFALANSNTISLQFIFSFIKINQGFNQIYINLINLKIYHPDTTPKFYLSKNLTLIGLSFKVLCSIFEQTSLYVRYFAIKRHACT